MTGRDDRGGALAGARLRLLATEISETSRVTSGRQLADGGDVVDLEVGSGMLTAVVLGLAGRPHTVTIINAGNGLELPWSVDTDCDCTDSGDVACEHVVAGLLVLAGEVAADVGLLDRWAETGTTATARREPAGGSPAGGELAGGDPAGRDPVDPPTTTPAIAGVDPLAAAITAGGTIPNVPILSVLDHPPIADPMLRALLIDALTVLASDE